MLQVHPSWPPRKTLFSRVIFFARYEASQLGSRTIETEHLLLGLIRENNGLTGQLLGRSKIEPEDIRGEIEARTRVREKSSTSVEIPLSVESKRVLAYAAEEAEKMFHKYIGTEHILLGLLREKKSLASRILLEKGMRLTTAREDLLYLLKEKNLSEKKKDTPFLSEFSRDLTALAAKDQLDPLIGREAGLERLIQIDPLLVRDHQQHKEHVRQLQSEILRGLLRLLGLVAETVVHLASQLAVPLSTVVKGRDSQSGIPRQERITSEDLRAAFAKPIAEIVETIRQIGRAHV